MKLELITHTPSTPRYTTPLLFIHGAWHGAWCWDEFFLPYFAQHGYTAHALSLRGHGQSTPVPLHWVSVQDYVADVLSITKSMDQWPVLIGHSMGGFTVQKYLETYYAPTAVLLASAPPRPIISPVLRMATHAPLSFLKTNLQLNPYPLVSNPEIAHKFLFSPTMSIMQANSYHERLQSESYRVLLEMLGLNLPRPTKVNTPLFVLGGANDYVFPPNDIEYTARAYNTTATILPNIAHDMMLDPQWQTAADAILAWLQTQNLT